MSAYKHVVAGESANGGNVVEFPEEYLKLQMRMAEAEEREVLRSAEAVVEAAIWKRRFRPGAVDGREHVSDETRKALVNLVMKDPTMTAYLFTDEAWERH